MTAVTKGIALYAKHFRPAAAKPPAKAPARSGPAIAAAMRGQRAIAKYARVGDGATRSFGKTAKQLDAEIAAAYRDRPPVLTRGSTTPLPPFPGPRTPAQLRGAVAKRERSAKAKPARATMTSAEFFDSLDPPLTRRGANSVTMPVVAKRVKADLDKAMRVGLIPEGTKFSIRTDHNSLRVEIVAWVGEVLSPPYLESLMDPSVKWDPEPRDYERGYNPRLSPALNKALQIADKIAELHNYNNSDISTDYFDVGYYCHVDANPVERTARAGVELESNKKLQALMEQGRVAASALGPSATKSICGDKDLRNADESCLKRLIKFAERAAGRAVVHHPRRGWIVDDGSVAKLASEPRIKLGKTEYGISGDTFEGMLTKGYGSIIGPRGGMSHLVRATASKGEKERGEVSSSWQHRAGEKHTWYKHDGGNVFSYSR